MEIAICILIFIAGIGLMTYATLSFSKQLWSLADNLEEIADLVKKIHNKKR